MYSLILLNGGIGRRAAADRPKQFVAINGLPIIVYSLLAADGNELIDEIVINYPEGWRRQVEGVVADYAVKTPVQYCPAGATRQESVAMMLPLCGNDRVLLHESARPMVGADDFTKIISDPHDNVSFMSRIPFTVAPVDPDARSVTGWLDRTKLRNVQLPQKFRKADLEAAHARAAAEGRSFTEDATLAKWAGHDVYFLEGQDLNIKVTTPADVRIVSSLLETRDINE